MEKDEKLKIIDFSFRFKVASFFVYHFVLFLVILFDLLIFNLRIKGRKNLNVSKAFLISNHALYLDPAIISHTIAPRRTYFTALEKTFRARFLGTFIRLLGAFPIPEETSLKRIIKPCQRALQERGLVHFFPEGELFYRNQELREFHNGVFSLSFMTGIPVIPITLIHRNRHLFGREISFLPPRVISTIGSPIYPKDFYSEIMTKKECIASMRDHARSVMIKSIAEENS